MTATKSFITSTALLFAALVAPAQAETPADFQSAWLAEARQSNPSFKTFSAERGQIFFKAQHGGDWRCASCHTDNPAQPGAHVVTKKSIDAMAPATNPRRFSDATKVEKWFRRNCKDVLARTCTAEEKGDVLAYLLAVKP